ncbi:MAG: hypothetical protein JXA89_24185 [Anaerolineae bacterium]|nr:hypothetical protein [Anaerolineae bacterium]
MLRITTRTQAQHTKARQFVLIRNGQPVVYDIHDSCIVLRRRGGVWVKYMIGILPSGTRFEASYGHATAIEVRRWQQDNGIGPVQRCALRTLHALVDRLAETVGLNAALSLFTRAISTAEAIA